VFVLLVLLTACGERDSVELVDPEIRVAPAMLERYETIDPDALLPENFYFIGVDQRYKTVDEIKKHQELLAYLSKTTGFQFKLLYSPEGVSSAEMLGDDLVQFAMVDAMGLVRAANEYGAEPLVREVAKDKRSVFVVKADSQISSLKNVKQQSLVLSIKGSIEGDLKPRVMLKKRGVLLSNIDYVYYANSPAECLRDVVSAKVDICALEERLASAHVDNGTLRVILRSMPYPTYGIANNIYVDDEVVQQVKQALLHYEKIAFNAGERKFFNLLLEQVNEFEVQGLSETQ